VSKKPPRSIRASLDFTAPIAIADRREVLSMQTVEPRPRPNEPLLNRGHSIESGPHQTSVIPGSPVRKPCISRSSWLKHGYQLYGLDRLHDHSRPQNACSILRCSTNHLDRRGRKDEGSHRLHRDPSTWRTRSGSQHRPNSSKDWAPHRTEAHGQVEKAAAPRAQV
jgi:hypothetical protein